ncbi:GTP-binding protein BRASSINAZOLE INSENSITIVE PALE GREEN 2, chloroplastic [Cynara cardunculus var. scolymus]|uniref:GTP-binding protein BRASSINAZOLE INSENSITIVE PALE GREEN 2, chloroplastic n=1 Tax=Cynara cardunculus var. scolymus TaxID=59895 RepID=UPI000D62E29B|nr:GTP-binding protein BRASSINAZOLE INSENSITIVE PALE GREEN 2, chloroplastic [Cynara cardunculus var. scolymus]
MIFRKLRPSKLKNLLPLSHFTTYTYKKPVSNSNFTTIINPHKISSLLNPTKTLATQNPLFRSFSSNHTLVPPLPITRDGNYDESTSETLRICPGCGIPMQDSDPKQPGFFITPSIKGSNYKLPIDKNPLAEETHIPESLKKGFLVESDEDPKNPSPKSPKRPVVCARCHSLRNYGRVRDQTVENLLPDFDFDHTVGKRLNQVSGTRTVVIVVVDAVDFDGSFPKKVAESISNTIDVHSRAWKEGKSGNLPRLVLVVTKIDLLPTSLSPTGFEHWVRTRAREGGANKLTKVHLVSAVKDWGLKDLADDMVSLAGPRGHVWVIGAQNAGKSTLINAMGKSVGGKMSVLTEAPVPGTTLGIVRVEGVLTGQAKLFDTPGLLHPHQITTRLTAEERKLVQISKELKPRTYRIKAGHSVHIGGLMRLDIEESSVDSLYVTVWASPHLPLHMGKTEKASTMVEDHFGHQLQPPIGKHRVEELGRWVRKEFRVTGNWWDSSCVDIAAAGLGWFAIGLKGEAVVGVWTYDGIDVTLRKALIPHRSHNFEVTGFTVSKIVSKADKSLNKQRHNEKKKVDVPETEATTAAL